jgi:hypothetical protein
LGKCRKSGGRHRCICAFMGETVDDGSLRSAAPGA